MRSIAREAFYHAALCVLILGLPACQLYHVDVFGSAEKKNSSSLVAAAQQGDFGKVRQLVLQKDAVNARDEEGMTALHYAALKGNAETASFLLSQGALPNAVNEAMWTPLHCAILGGDKATVDCLLGGGAQAGATNGLGFTPLMLGAYLNSPAMLEPFLRAPQVSTDLMQEHYETGLHAQMAGRAGELLGDLCLTASGEASESARYYSQSARAYAHAGDLFAKQASEAETSFREARASEARFQAVMTTLWVASIAGGYYSAHQSAAQMAQLDSLSHGGGTGKGYGTFVAPAYPQSNTMSSADFAKAKNTLETLAGNMRQLALSSERKAKEASR